ncbi:hypothetical protein HRI_004767000 [Hibiscus trionum]|uniref:Uncharacterized protein n=1 Tax=Hibiscus trionum TaxID=183268 RepID=A0A9W7JDT6_HIBTR|nr:hypothetical protein HRI_004767000 [Hibiscus trionum]
MKMITCDRVTHDAAITAHPKYASFFNKKLISMMRWLCSIPLNFNIEDVNEEGTKVSSSGTSKRKRKNIKESDEDDRLQFVGEKLGEIAEALKKFNEDKTPHLYEEVMSMEFEGFDDEFLYNVFDFLGKNESEAKIFLAKKSKHKKIWLQKFTQG